MHCGSCSLVTSSGHLTGGGRGKEIDSAECVIRMNDAPSGGVFGPDVGRRTTLRVIAHSSMQRVLRSRHELLNSSHDTVFIFWGPSNYMRRDGKGLIYNNLRLMNQVLPKLKVYIISWQKMLQFDELFKKETGKDRYEKTAQQCFGSFVTCWCPNGFNDIIHASYISLAQKTSSINVNALIWKKICW